ncbi:DUF484 family protein [Inmirania thermothiophila]|uniref:DUF484 family protein n=1 Tax=Inmirania thermothiophila TaxID=1750597 RepID=A0A3N1Y7A5_9GAMM|nr:DUF484 family protein [Inmirania thermothiophila]ROR34408.1 hypothetical protein EDC57_0304 [Inmirania thermothiophila]
MSSQRQSGLDEDAATEALVARYLSAHPDFFERHKALLAAMRLRHECGAAVSLIERQVQVLREQNQGLRRKLTELIEVARDNDRLHERLHRLALALMDAGGAEDVVATVREHMMGTFHADAVALVLFDADAAALPDGARAVARDDPELERRFGNFLGLGKPLCGRLTREQLEFLFAEAAGEVASAALVPLCAGRVQGILAIGSREPERFLQGMGTLFLGHMGELVAHALGGRLGG